MQDLECHLKSSLWMTVGWLIAMILSGMSLYLLSWRIYLKGGLLFIVILYFSHLFYHQKRTAIHCLRFQQGKWFLQTAQGDFEASLCGSSTVTRFVSILQFKIPGKWLRRTCIIFRDSLEKEVYRRLLVLLRSAVNEPLA